MIRLLFAAALFAASPVAGQTISAPASLPADAAAMIQAADAKARAAQDAADAAVAAAAAAQRSVPDVSTLATKASLSVVEAKIPVPAASVPPMEMVAGSVGTAGTYRPADAANQRITRAGVVTTNSTGDWSITWSSALPLDPIVLPVPVNTTTQPVICNVSTRTKTGATGRCWLARSLPATLTLLTNLISYDIFGGAATGLAVQVLAIPPTQ